MNMTFRNSFVLGLSLVSASFSLGVANAGAITVNNADFEQLPAGGLDIAYGGPGGGFFSEKQIPGWTNGGATGQYQPAVLSDIFNFIPGGGAVFGYSNGPTISQTVGATVQVGDVYTMSVYIGNRNDVCCGPLGGADLLVNGVAYAATGTTATNGNWSLFTATYTGLAQDAGDSITIQLTSAGAQGDYDLVSLSDNGGGAAPAPEPGSVLLMATGLASMFLLVRRRLNRSV